MQTYVRICVVHRAYACSVINNAKHELLGHSPRVQNCRRTIITNSQSKYANFAITEVRYYSPY